MLMRRHFLPRSFLFFFSFSVSNDFFKTIFFGFALNHADEYAWMPILLSSLVSCLINGAKSQSRVPFPQHYGSGQPNAEKTKHSFNNELESEWAQRASKPSRAESVVSSANGRVSGPAITVTLWFLVVLNHSAQVPFSQPTVPNQVSMQTLCSMWWAFQWARSRELDEVIRGAFFSKIKSEWKNST